MWQQRQSGKQQPRSVHDLRDAYERDCTRVVHCSALRRLQRKTQILGTNNGDFHRTRLTHSLEVASIARSIARQLRRQQATTQPDLKILPSDDLITAISLLHDIGHPPFGHGGETALNYMMQDHGGFESNGQTLRLITKLEHDDGHYGLDLTRRTLLGILKYPQAYSQLLATIPPPTNTDPRQIRINNWLPPKCYLDSENDQVAWILEPLTTGDLSKFQSSITPSDKTKHASTCYKSLDCAIMDIADNIAYGVHDLEDAIHLQLIKRHHFESTTFEQLFTEAFDPQQRNISHPTEFLEQLFSPFNKQRKDAIGDLVNSFIAATKLTTVDYDFEEQLLRYTAQLPEQAQQLLDFFIQIIYQHVINSHTARTLEYGGQTIVRHLFEAIASNPEQLLSTTLRHNYQQACDDKQGARVICDYISSMTDGYAHDLHEKLFG